MNDRVKELWVEATQSIWPAPGKFTAGEYDYNLEKFAELIVKECIGVIQKEVSLKYKDGVGETEDFMGGHYAASVLSRVKIKQHFGVEND